MQKTCKILLAALFALPLLVSTPVHSAPSNDSRIKTYVYGKNDIFRLTTTYGYQSSVELDPEEVVETISLGNSAAFKVNPSGSRIFVRPLQMQQITNMTVVTDRRTYQFELTSTDENASDLMYVVRFYYPESSQASVQKMSAAPMPFPQMFMAQPPADSSAMGMPVQNSAIPSAINIPRVSISGVSPQANEIPTGAPANIQLPDAGTLPVPSIQSQTIVEKAVLSEIPPTAANIPASMRYKYNNSF